MHYRQIGDLKVSALGFGAMRLPLGPQKTIDEKETERMIRRGLERGLNYIDTAAPYHDGLSEVALGNILSRGLRDKVLLTTKLPCWLVQKCEDFDKLLDDQLKKLKTDHLDFYLLHALFTERWEGVKKLDVIGWLEKKKAQGKIRHIGFSFHDNADVFKRIVDEYDGWEMVQIQYNYMDEDFQAGTAGLRHAAAKKIPVVVMEPLRGGFLADPPAPIRAVFDEAGLNPAATALRWLWSRPEVSMVLSGMSTMRQMEENLNTADQAGNVILSPAERAAVEKARAIYADKTPIPCTQCGYCMPCPFDVLIPDNLALYNKSVIFENLGVGQVQYLYHTPDKNKAGACTACRECESKCPQNIKVSEWMPKIHAAFTAG
jgi:predicted aldo/keto reductase-like oxidoreductase